MVSFWAQTALGTLIWRDGAQSLRSEPLGGAHAAALNRLLEQFVHIDSRMLYAFVWLGIVFVCPLLFFGCSKRFKVDE